MTHTTQEHRTKERERFCDVASCSQEALAYVLFCDMINEYPHAPCYQLQGVHHNSKSHSVVVTVRPLITSGALTRKATSSNKTPSLGYFSYERIK